MEDGAGKEAVLSALHEPSKGHETFVKRYGKYFGALRNVDNMRVLMTHIGLVLKVVQILEAPEARDHHTIEHVRGSPRAVLVGSLMLPDLIYIDMSR